MDASLLKKLFGGNAAWSKPCVVVVAGDAVVQTLGTDSVTTGGGKAYAPRVPSGRIEADCACFLADVNAVALLQRKWHRTHSGEDRVAQTVWTIASEHIVAIEMDGTSALERLGVTPPPMPDKMHYASGTLVG